MRRQISRQLRRVRSGRGQGRASSVWHKLSKRGLKTRRQRIVAGVIAAVFVVSLVVPLVMVSRKAEASWWNASWGYRRKITFNNAASSENLTNFPIRVSLSAANSNIDYSKTQSAGQDIRFVDSDDTTQLSHEIEVWDEAGTSEVWVKIPQIDSGSTTDFIWMYYGRATASDGQNATAVWDSTYRATWHLKEAASSTVGGYKDSTSNVNHGQGGAGTAANVPAQADAKIGKGSDFDGTTDLISVPSHASLNNLSPYMIEAWIFADTVGEGSHGRLFDRSGFHYASTDNDATYVNTVGAYREAGASNAYSEASDNSLSFSTWTHITITYDPTSTKSKIYKNGAEVTYEINDSAVGALTSDAGTMIIGNRSAGDRTFDGKIDEFRYSSSAYSAERIEANYITQNNAMNSFGSEETPTSISPTTDTWWNNSWAYRRKIFLNNSASAEALINFPAMVAIDPVSINYSYTQNLGQDIRFVDADDTTQLSHEIEVWDETGTSTMWVKVPQIDAASTTDYIWMYYGNTGASNGENITDVWSNGYIAVWHLQQSVNDNTAGLLDSVGSWHATPKNLQDGGGGATAAAGKIGKGVIIEGDDDFLDLATASTVTANRSAMTLSGWMYLQTAPASDENIISVGINTNNCSTTDSRISLNTVGGPPQITTNASVRAPDSGASFTITDPNLTDIAATTWNNLATVVNISGDNIATYNNGVLRTSQAVAMTNTATDNTGAGCSRLGAEESGAEMLDGTLDEVRISNGTRTTDWLEAEYVSGSDAMNTFTLEEKLTPEPPVLTSLGNHAPLQPQFQLRSADPNSPDYLRYKIELCSNSDCSSIIRTIDQTSSQTGWTGQDAQTSTAYVASSTLASSTLASHNYQTPALTQGTTYYWRAYAIDPNGSNLWSEASDIASFITTVAPSVPTLVTPANNASTAPDKPTLFQLWSSDANSDSLVYKIDVCSTSNCSAIVRTIDLLSSQTGWLTLNAASGTRYSSSPILASSQLATHEYQPAFLTAGTQYWWRAYARDPDDTDAWTAASSIYTFNTHSTDVRILGGTKIQGGTTIGQ